MAKQKGIVYYKEEARKARRSARTSQLTKKAYMEGVKDGIELARRGQQ
ncbi:unnamed protein product [marine sediment metagenome]|uniref:Uncharacterized protein n=1 Tax=marine sediment metagenome TaxID=412755 RepID=X1SJ10_9ZZZZ